MNSSSSSCSNDLNEAIIVAPVKTIIPKFATRSQLPAHSCTKNISIWTALKKCIGKDLTTVTFPIIFNEPLSFLQRLAEYMEYVSLIKQASASNDPIKRMELISSFALSTLSSSPNRLAKPFNPLLYETYELLKPELGFKFVAEQVSHHPPISAFHSQGDEFEFFGNVEPKIKFWGRSLEYTSQASFTLILKPFNEKYTWQGISCSVHNLYMGKMYLCLNGTMNIQCEDTDMATDVKFGAAGKGETDTLLYGEIYQGKTPIKILYGNWTEYIASTPLPIYNDYKHQWKKEYKVAEKNGKGELVTLFPGSQVLWRVHKKPPGNKDYYNLTYFAMTLNEKPLDPSKLPRTDVRLRPDIRLMEDGSTDRASQEKERLEGKQRARAKQRAVESSTPEWFSIKDDAGAPNFYSFNGTYWNREFSNCEDIY